MKIFIEINGKKNTIVFKQRNGVLNRINTLAMKETGKVQGRAKVSYGKGFDNQFDFTSVNDLKKKLVPCLEKELLRFVNG